MIMLTLHDTLQCCWSLLVLIRTAGKDTPKWKYTIMKRTVKPLVSFKYNFIWMFLWWFKSVVVSHTQQPLMEDQPTDLSDVWLFWFCFCYCGLSNHWSDQQLTTLPHWPGHRNNCPTAAQLRRLEGVKCRIWVIRELYLFHFLSQSPALLYYSSPSVWLLFVVPRHTTEGLTSLISHLCSSIFIFVAFKHSTQPPPSLLPNAGIRE